MDDFKSNGQQQLGFDLGDAPAARSYAPDPADIRAELLQLLETARAAQDRAPWDARTFRYHKTVFPQMARWLPDDERDQLCFAFAEQVERIELLMAA